MLDCMHATYWLRKRHDFMDYRDGPSYMKWVHSRDAAQPAVRDTVDVTIEALFLV